MGKPRKITFRVSINEFNDIQERAANAKMNLSQYCSNCVLNKKIIVLDGLPKFTRELSKIGTNVNQLATLANMQKISVVDLSSTKKELTNIWQLLNSLKENIKH